jgi:hypothetical protein
MTSLVAVLQRAVIRATVTGATVATILPPRHFDTFVAASAAADDRTFVLAAQNVSRDGLATCGPTGLILARFNPSDHQVAVRALPVREFPATSQVDEIALSPDGTRLAVAFESGRSCQSGAGVPLDSPGDVKSHEARREEISVYFLPSRTVKTWQSSPAWSSNGGYLRQNAMSWATDGTLAVNNPGSQGGPPSQGVWLINTNTAGGKLLDDGRLAVSAYAPELGRAHRVAPLPWTWSGYGVLTPDGKTVVAPMQHTNHSGAAFGEFAASTGNLVQVLWPDRVSHRAFLDPYYSAVWTNSSGSVLVVAAPESRKNKAGAQSVYGVLRGHRFTPIPGAPRPLTFLSDTVIVF